MKKQTLSLVTLLAIVSLLTTINGYGQISYPHFSYLENYEDFESDFELNPELEWFYQDNVRGDTTLYCKKPSFEFTELLMMSEDFTTDHNNIGIDRSSIFNFDSNMDGIYADITIYRSNDYTKSTYKTKRFDMNDYINGIPIYDAFELNITSPEVVSIKNMVITAYYWNRGESKSFDDISITNLIQYYVELPDYNGFYVSFIPTHVTINDTTNMSVWFYYGSESGYVDIYIAIQNAGGLFFFPYWTTEIYKTTVYISQFSNAIDWIHIMTYNVSDLPLELGWNDVYMLVTKHDAGETVGEMDSTFIVLEEGE